VLRIKNTLEKTGIFDEKGSSEIAIGIGLYNRGFSKPRKEIGRCNSLVISVERSSLQLQLTPLLSVHDVEHDVDDYDGKANQGQRED